MGLEFDHHASAHGGFCRGNAAELVHQAVGKAFPSR